MRANRQITASQKMSRKASLPLSKSRTPFEIAGDLVSEFLRAPIDGKSWVEVAQNPPNCRTAECKGVLIGEAQRVAPPVGFTEVALDGLHR
jgi:hypothetical protein